MEHLYTNGLRVDRGRMKRGVLDLDHVVEVAHRFKREIRRKGLQPSEDRCNRGFKQNDG